MSYLLDVSPLLALIWEGHPHHHRVRTWQSGQDLVLCPLTELGFVRISTQPCFGATVAQARTMLRDWKAARKPRFIPCDLAVLDTEAPTAGSQTTDFYLASLAAKHGMHLATLDQALKHKAAFLIPGT